VIDQTRQQVSISGNVIADLTYEPMGPSAFSAALDDAKRAPLYKQDGFFLFTNIAPGEYMLRLSAQYFQSLVFDVMVPPVPLLSSSPPAPDTLHTFWQPGDNELIVVIQGVNASTGRVTFAAELLTKGIPMGSQVQAVAFSATLRENLEPGLVSSALLDSAVGLTPGEVLRIIRGRSIRMRFDPYNPTPAALTQIVGHVAMAEDPLLPLERAQVRLTQIDGVAVTTLNVEGAQVATLNFPASTTILGTAADLITETNVGGDYSLYSGRTQNWTSVTLEVSRNGSQTQTLALPVLTSQRNRADFLLVRG